MRRFYSQIVVGLLLSVLVSGMSATYANALTPQAPATVSLSQLAAVDLSGDDLTCGNSDDFGFSIGDGLNIPEADSIITNYIICPLLEVVYGAVGLMLNALESTGLLQVQPLLENGSPTDATDELYAAWAVFRDLANFGLIVGLFLIVFSQATSYGLSAYGVRKMLPKLVVAALLVNLSYIICAVLVDVFNILGSSLDDTLYSAITSRVNGTEGDIISDALTRSGVNDSGIMLLMGLVMLLILFALLLIGLLCLMFLVARQILLMILIMASPIAFIAWLFPNTEGSFRKWWSTLIRLLAIYPVVMCLKVVVLVILIAMASLIP